MSIQKDDREELRNLKNKKVEISIFTPIQFTEDSDKVLDAVKTLFPEIKLTIEENNIRGWSTNPQSLLHLADSIRIHKNLDSSRRIMRKSFSDDIIRLDFDKQAALHDRFHFCTPNDAPLGTIVLQIITPDPESLIDIIAPKWEWIRPLKSKKR